MTPSEKRTAQYVLRIRDMLVDDDRYQVSNRLITVFSRTVLERRYSVQDRNTCTLYQAMIGSVPSQPETRFDFPGDDSVLTFIEGLAMDLAPEKFAKLKEEFEREYRREGRS